MARESYFWMTVLGGVAAAALALFSCSPSGNGGAARAPGPLRVVVSIPPLEWVVRQLAPPGTEITLITPAGVGCEGVELTPAHIVAIDRADVIALTGLGLEPHVERAMRRRVVPGRRVVSFLNAPDVRPKLIAASPHDHDHAEGEDHGHHHHGDLDPHAWLDPTLMDAYAQELFTQLTGALESIEPDAATRSATVAGMRGALQRVRQTCSDLDLEYAERLAGARTRSLITEHNGFAYLARRYDLTVAATLRPLHDVEPTPADIEKAGRAAREGGARAIFVEPQYSQAGARRVAEVNNLQLLVLDALGDGDYPGMMRHNLDALSQGLGAEGPRDR